MKNYVILSVMLISSLRFVNAQDKIVVTKAEDLPKHSYVLENKDALAIVKNKENIMDLAAMIKNDLLADLGKYDIKENATLRGYYGKLRNISILEGDYNKAIEYIKIERKLADKASQKITLGISTEAFINAVVQYNTMEPNIINTHITKSLEDKLHAADFVVIQEDIEAAKGRIEIMGENILLGLIKSQIQPALDNNQGEVPGNLVNGLINMYYTLNYFIPYKEAFHQAYRMILEENEAKVEKHNIWKEREIEIKENPKYSNVIIGIWDSGVDTPILPKKKQWKNDKEKFDGKDSDGNGFIDDVYGIAHNMEGLKDPNYLEPMANNLKDKLTYQQFLKGFMDLRSNINSKEASNLKNYLTQLKSEDVKGFIETLSLYSNYAHGTHVAGIAEAGNEMAKIMSARITFNYKSIPSPPNEEIIANKVKSFGEIVGYLKDKKVRVVNMSWHNSYEGTVSVLELNGIGKDDQERKALAKTYFTTLYNSFKKALQSAEEILFVCAAGNSNDDVDFSANYPSSLNLPNLITVGAVDIEGKKTSFTTEGKSVDVYANGYEVESYVPGGDRVAFSGTSMASPNVANLAGKILAVNPKLNPEQVIEIIINTSTKSEEDERVLLIHPRNAIELALN
ncbi:S8 family serine peptidase [Tamlana flava]|uniref:S8 family serine peptidase n=1 Tax=Tamlana flava TaxID=3158572 RepID=UPI00351AEDDA